MQVVHGLSIPLGKLGYYLPRTISRGLPSPTTEGGTISSFHIGARMSSTIPFRRTRTSGRSSLDTSLPRESPANMPQPIFRIGGSVIPSRPRPDVVDPDRTDNSDANTLREPDKANMTVSSAAVVAARTIRFPDEPPLENADRGGNKSRDAGTMTMEYEEAPVATVDAANS